MSGRLVIMGSGETAPTMVKPHRAVFDFVGDRPAVLLDTPYGFQENADDISARALNYFAASVGRKVQLLGWRTTPPPGLARERAVMTLREAGWIFAGPGSPTYALRQWRDTPIPELLAETLAGGAALVFASAAALTLGSHTVPVYEIYKAGVAPAWEPGLDLVRRVTGLPAVVIPHYDNAEGGHHDTRHCYLGERRLAALERQLPPESFVLGVDEHTAVVLDLAARTATVSGNGRLTLRRRGSSQVYPTGSVLDFAELAVGPVQAPALVAQAPPAPDGAAGTLRTSTVEPASLAAATAGVVARFDAALARRDVDGCVAEILGLEQTRLDWAADTLTSDECDRARAELRRMVLRLGELATIGARDPVDTLGPYIEALLELRRQARAGRDFARSDWIRDQLTKAGAEIRDTPAGVSWHLT